MQINVTKIKSTAETKESVNLQEQINAAEFGYEELEFAAPVEFAGVMEHTAPYFRLAGEVRAEVKLMCSRCLAEFTLPIAVPIAEVYTNKQEALPDVDEDAEDVGFDEIGFFEGDEVDITPALLKALFLELPMRPLCREDCRGMCPECGADLNRGECGCRADNVDFRLEKLKTLFAQMQNDDSDEEV